MAGPSFDPNQAIKFDLKSGSAADARGHRVVLVPSVALDALEPDVLEKIGEEIGRACGARFAARLGGEAAVRSAPLEAVVSHLAGELAVAGVGSVQLERWGRAMVIVVTNAGVKNDRFLSGVLSGALGAASGRSLAAAALNAQGDPLRFFIGAEATAARVRDLVKDGKGHGDVLAGLQGGAS